jgi:hypothetical protein
LGEAESVQKRVVVDDQTCFLNHDVCNNLVKTEHEFALCIYTGKIQSVLLQQRNHEPMAWHCLFAMVTIRIVYQYPSADWFNLKMKSAEGHNSR